MTEVIYDFVFTPPRAQIGFQSSVIPDTGTHLRTALFVFELGKSTYVTIPFLVFFYDESIRFPKALLLSALSIKVWFIGFVEY